MSNSPSESDIEIKPAPLPKKKVKIQKSPSDDVINNTKKATTKMMIVDALTQLKTRKGVSAYAIKKYLSEKYQLNTEKLNYLIKKSLKTGVEDGTFVQVKGVGASGSFKLAVVKEKSKKPKKKKEPEKSAKEPKKTDEKKVLEKQVTKKPKMRMKEVNVTEQSEPVKKKVEVKVTKKVKEKEKKEEKQKKPKAKVSKEKQSPTKKRVTMMKRKSIGTIIKAPKMKPTRT